MRYTASNINDELVLGKQGENGAVTITFPVSRFYKEYGRGGSFVLLHQRTDDEQPYPCGFKLSGDALEWTVSNADNAHVGRGLLELRYLQAGKLVKSITWHTVTLPSIGEPGENPPEPYKAWIDDVTAAGAAAVKAKEGIENMSVSGHAAESASVSKTVDALGNIRLEFGLPRGNDGRTPQKGIDYFTPAEVSAFKAEVTPVKGIDYFDGNDGRTPQKGIDYFTPAEVSAFKAEVTPVKGRDYFDGYTPIKGVDYNDGYTPVKGVDYFTAGEVATFKQEVTPVKGVDYFDGQDGHTPTVSEIRTVFQEDLDALEADIDEKMARYVIRLVKNADNTYKLTSLEDADLSFSEVYEVTRKLNEYVVVVYGSSKLRPQYVSTNEIMFIGVDRSTDSKILRILFTPTRLTYETFALAEKTDLASKADKTEVDEAVRELNEDLAAKISDVKINGTALAKVDGVVEIPTAQVDGGNGQKGVVGVQSVGYGGGLLLSNGYLRMYGASESQISNRTAAYFGFLPTQIDSIVKAALTDGKGTDWTADEQNAALTRLGIPFEDLRSQITFSTRFANHFQKFDTNQTTFVRFGNMVFLNIACRCLQDISYTDIDYMYQIPTAYAPRQNSVGLAYNSSKK